MRPSKRAQALCPVSLAKREKLTAISRAAMALMPAAALALMRGDQPEAGDPEEKAEDVQSIAEFMVENGYCTAETLPRTVIAWDLVRIANLGRWALHAGYLSKEEMWQVMQVAADAAREHFSSWEEYGRSFAMGRGVWHGDEEDCQTAWEIVTTQLEVETSPWQQIPWNA